VILFKSLLVLAPTHSEERPSICLSSVAPVHAWHYLTPETTQTVALRPPINRWLETDMRTADCPFVDLDPQSLFWSIHVSYTGRICNDKNYGRICNKTIYC